VNAVTVNNSDSENSAVQVTYRRELWRVLLWREDLCVIQYLKCEIVTVAGKRLVETRNPNACATVNCKTCKTVTALYGLCVRVSKSECVSQLLINAIIRSTTRLISGLHVTICRRLATRRFPEQGILPIVYKIIFWSPVNGEALDRIGLLCHRSSTQLGFVVCGVFVSTRFMQYSFLWGELIECSLCRLIRRLHTDISCQTECHSFGDHLISGWVSVTPSSVIEASIVAYSVSLWLVGVDVQSACALNTRYFKADPSRCTV
jgi:hypothetical protein